MFRDNFLQNKTVSTSQNNASGLINRIKLIPAELVNRILTKNGKLDNSFIQLKKAGYLPDDIELAEYSATFVEDQIEESGRVTYNTTITFNIPSTSAEVSNYFLERRYVKQIAIVLDRNLNVRCFGSPEYPLTITMNNSAGTPVDGGNGYVCTLTGVSAQAGLFGDNQTAFESPIRVSSFNNSFSTIFQ
ncbi:hypothetical protein [Flectobacillus roseus]|uniref:hypothetical protein n=1 Tax=Flectobacillus roseus TaxID=502259 RepID=UPI0024B77AED|nr:hypothetical protein [Flectobacillus roseus]MDI9871311.1 hypothetical protein [Flectobacillus roseus]